MRPVCEMHQCLNDAAGIVPIEGEEYWICADHEWAGQDTRETN